MSRGLCWVRESCGVLLLVLGCGRGVGFGSGSSVSGFGSPLPPPPPLFTSHAAQHPAASKTGPSPVLVRLIELTLSTKTSDGLIGSPKPLPARGAAPQAEPAALGLVGCGGDAAAAATVAASSSASSASRRDAAIYAALLSMNQVYISWFGVAITVGVALFCAQVSRLPPRGPGLRREPS